MKILTPPNRNGRPAFSSRLSGSVERPGLAGKQSRQYGLKIRPRAAPNQVLTAVSPRAGLASVSENSPSLAGIGGDRLDRVPARGSLSRSTQKVAAVETNHVFGNTSSITN